MNTISKLFVLRVRNVLFACVYSRSRCAIILRFWR